MTNVDTENQNLTDTTWEATAKFFAENLERIRQRPNVNSMFNRPNRANALQGLAEFGTGAQLDLNSSLKFRPNQVELLTNQASDLLDRLQRELATYNELRARAKAMNIEGMAQLAEIQQMEEWIKGEVHNKLPKAQKEEREAASNYLKVAPPSDPDATWPKIYAKYVGAQEAAMTASAKRSEPSSEGHLLIAERWKLYLDCELRNALQLAMKHRVEYAEQEALKFAATASTLRKLHTEKAKALMPGQEYDFDGQFSDMERQFNADWLDIDERIRSISLGLVLYYSFTDDPGVSATLPPQNWERPGAAVSWIRSIAAWLISFSHRDVSATVRISLKQLIGDQEWDSLFKSLFTDGVCRCAFLIDEIEFGNRCNVRLIGISAMTIGYTGHPLKATLAPPKIAKVRSRFNGCVRIVQQKFLPEILLGRIDAENSNRDPEIVGTNSLRNASPVGDEAAGDDGKWTIALSTMTAPSKDLVPKDIWLEIGINFVEQDQL